MREADTTASLAALRAFLTASQAGRMAGVLILEPSVQGAAGMQVAQPPGFVREVAALCRAHDVHLILDEVFVAFGRLGVMMVCAEEGVAPDFLCLGKRTYRRLPAARAATLTCARKFSGRSSGSLAEEPPWHFFPRPHLHRPIPLAAAVALENIRKLRALIADGTLRARSACFGRLLDETFSDHPHVREIRQRPVLPPRSTSRRRAAPPKSFRSRAAPVCKSACARGPTACCCVRWAIRCCSCRRSASTRMNSANSCTAPRTRSPMGSPLNLKP